MQFSYRVTEAEYKQAMKMRVRKGIKGSFVFRTVMFWVFILICLMMLWAVVNRKNQVERPTSDSEQTQSDQIVPQTDQPKTTSVGNSLLVNVGPFILIAGVWIFMLFQMGPRRIRRLYRNDPAMQGQYTIEVTPNTLSFQNTAGVSAQSGWNIYDYWQEARGVIVLVYKSAAHFIISEAELTEAQRAELRGILASALPQK